MRLFSTKDCRHAFRHVPGDPDGPKECVVCADRRKYDQSMDSPWSGPQVGTRDKETCEIIHTTQEQEQLVSLVSELSVRCYHMARYT